MSSDVGVSDRGGAPAGGIAPLGALLRQALAGAPEVRGTERVLAESFWAARGPRPLPASRIDRPSVVPLRHLRRS